MSRYYDVCCKNIGRPVYIRTIDGREHRGVISHVSRSHVYLKPMGRGVAGEEELSEINQKARFTLGTKHVAEGKEILFWGYGWGLGIGIALGAIGTLAFLPFFFW